MKKSEKMRIKQLEEEIKQLNEELNILRTELVSLYKKCYHEDDAKKLQVPKMSKRILDKASKIKVREIAFISDLYSLIRKISISGIKDLKQLYERVSDGTLTEIQRVGKRSENIIKALIKNLPNLISQVEQRRENLKRLDVRIEYAIEDRYVVECLKKKDINTLSEAYYADIDTNSGLLSKEKEEILIAIFKQY